MTRRLVLVAAVSAVLLSSRGILAEVRTPLITQTEARHLGMKRAWFTQVPMDRSRSRVRDLVLDRGTLLVQDDRAMLTALDAETGETLWASQIGNPMHPSLVPGVNGDLVAVVNGSFLYVVNRFNGKLLWKTQLEGAPGAGAALSRDHAYVPTVQGLMFAYPLQPAKDPLEELGVLRREPRPSPEESAEERVARMESFRLSQEVSPPLACQVLGRSMIQPVVAREDKAMDYVVWPTDSGFMFVAVLDRREERFGVKYRLGTASAITAQPSYLPPSPETPTDPGALFASSNDGFVYAISDKSGDVLWRFSTGVPLVEPPVLVGETLYVATQPGGMYCVDAKSGAQKWWAPAVLQFVAKSRDRVYAVDKLSQLRVLDAANGSLLDTMSVVAQPIRLRNGDTDRVYLAAEGGLIQCLHEIELAEPIDYAAARRPKPDKPAPIQQGTLPAGEEGPGEAKPDEAAPEQPTEPEPAPAQPSENPFEL